MLLGLQRGISVPFYAARAWDGTTYEGGSDKDIYGGKTSNYVYSTDNSDYQNRGNWQYDPVHNVVYGSQLWGPVIFKKLGPGTVGMNQSIKSAVAPGLTRISFVQSASRLKYSIEQSGHVRIDIKNLKGRFIQTVVDQNLDAGGNLVSPMNRPKGMILASLRKGPVADSTRMVIGASK